MPKRKPESARSLARKREFRKLTPAMRIYCNGAQTEKKYCQSLLEELRLTALVQIIAYHDNRLSLVTKVKHCLAADGYKVDEEHKVWVIFDVDACPKGNNNIGVVKSQADNAVFMCHRLGFTPIVSNDSFEYWFYLHYNPSDFAHRHRDDLANILSRKIGEKYEKDTEMYCRLRSKQNSAMAGAKKLCDSYGKPPVVSRCRPYTNVHELIEVLREIAG